MSALCSLGLSWEDLKVRTAQWLGAGIIIRLLHIFRSLESLNIDPGAATPSGTR